MADVLHPQRAMVPRSKLTREVTAKINVAVDVVLLAAASIASTYSGGKLDPIDAAAAFAATSLMWFLGSRVLRHYDPEKWITTLNDAVLTTLLASAVVAAPAIAAAVSPRVAGAVRPWDFLEFFLAPVLVARVSFRHSPRVLEEVVIVGTGPLARHTAIEVAGEDHRRVTGFLSFPGDEPDERLPAPVIGRAEDLERVLRERAVDEVYLADSVRRHGDAMQAAVCTCERFGVPFAVPAAHLRFDRALPVGGQGDGYIHYLTWHPRPVQMLVKRGIDLAASAAALVVLSPLFVAIAAAIKLTSRGPVFFRQKRVGQYGRTFAMLKFRSMVAGADAMKAELATHNEKSGPVFKMKHDPRVTAVGRFIRKFSLDELPQLVNVLRGEMTLVGPRPPIPSEVAKYEPWQRRRLSVRPGLTCIWQVSGRDAISFERWMYLDMQYIDNWSLLRDLELILKTVPVVLTGRGAS